MKRAAPIVRRKALSRSKYGNKRVLVGDRMFDSKGEAERATELRLLEKAGHIRDLEFQVTFPLYGKNGSEVARYRADFTYHDLRTGLDVTEDFKGVRTEVYRMKAKLFRDNYGRAIFESTARRTK